MSCCGLLGEVHAWAPGWWQCWNLLPRSTFRPCPSQKSLSRWSKESSRRSRISYPSWKSVVFAPCHWMAKVRWEYRDFQASRDTTPSTGFWSRKRLPIRCFLKLQIGDCESSPSLDFATPPASGREGPKRCSRLANRGTHHWNRRSPQRGKVHSF